MINKILLWIILFLSFLPARGLGAAEDLSGLKSGQKLADFRVTNLYGDSQDKIVGVKLAHIPSSAPVFVFQIETVPQVFTWVDTPSESDKGLAHSLEHLLAGKGTKGRYFTLLRNMRLGQSSAATGFDFNFYGLSSATGMDGFLEQFHALLDALYHPDFTDIEAEREFYHFGVTSDRVTGKKTLIEEGSVYDEMETDQGKHTYYFELNKRVLGETNPFGFSSGGVPDAMRAVTPQEIRNFHAEHYRLGPATGFIFVLDPRENLARFLQKISGEFQQLPMTATPSVLPKISKEPKYPIHPSQHTEPRIYPFPGVNEAASGFVHFAWRPMQAGSPVEVKLLQLLLRGFAQGERSLLYKALVDSKTRMFDSGATGVDSDLSLANSPSFPVSIVEISGIPGNHISVEQIERLKSLTLAKIREVSEYADQSEGLESFNQIVELDAQSWSRSERVWTKTTPGFGSRELKTDWKEYLEYLDMDSSFIRSVSEQRVWQAIEEQLKSGKNIWRDLIYTFHLLDSPYAAASAPSPKLAEALETTRELRMQKMISTLMERSHTADDQAALSQFEEEELSKTKEIDAIEARITRPRFTEHPPLTPDDDIRYKQFKLSGNVPTIFAIFDNAPTIDLGLSFDLRQVPRKYYKYLPMLPRCLDSLGLKEGEQILPYSALLAESHKTAYAFSVGYEVNAVSKRADFTIRASATNAEEFRRLLDLIRKMMRFNYLDETNANRLKDVLARRVSGDSSYVSGSQWFLNPAYAYRYRDDDLFLALYSQFTRAHWDDRMQWLLHKPVASEEIHKLASFADVTLSSFAGASRDALSQSLNALNASGLEGELVEYWKKSLSSFPVQALIQGLRQLTLEVQEDLGTGPARTIEDLKELQKIVLNHHLLHVDITSDPSVFDAIRADLVRFVRTIPILPLDNEHRSANGGTPKGSIVSNIEKRQGASDAAFPWYVGFANADGITGSVAFYADFFGYSQLDHESLVRVLSSKLVSANGPHSVYMKTREAGLAYVNSISSDPRSKLLFYYADRSPDIPSLLGVVNSVAARIPDLRDPFLVDYALRQTFSVPRSMSTFSERGMALAQDIRDGNRRETIRRFSLAVLKLRRDPDLLSELTRAGRASIGPVLVGEEYKEQQRSARSMFFFSGPEKMLADTESMLSIPKILRVWPSDFWLP